MMDRVRFSHTTWVCWAVQLHDVSSKCSGSTRRSSPGDSYDSFASMFSQIGSKQSATFLEPLPLTQLPRLSSPNGVVLAPSAIHADAKACGRPSSGEIKISPLNISSEDVPLDGNKATQKDRRCLIVFFLVPCVVIFLTLTVSIFIHSIYSTVDSPTEEDQRVADAVTRGHVPRRGDMVTSWGFEGRGCSSSLPSVADQLSSDVEAVHATSIGFAAVKRDESVVMWGVQRSFLLPSRAFMASGAEAFAATKGAIAAVKSDGSAVAWGDARCGGDSSAVLHLLSSGVKAVFATTCAFAALKSDGSVVNWGSYSFNGLSIYKTPPGGVVHYSAVAAQLSGGVVGVYANEWAFAALKSDGSIVTWGNDLYGGDSSLAAAQLSSGVEVVYPSQQAFAAVKSSGRVVAWGHPGSGGDASAVAYLLLGGVKLVYVTDNAFAAVKIDGSVVTWGRSDVGGDSHAVASQLSSGVEVVSATLGAFAALKNDGSVVAWGLDKHLRSVHYDNPRRWITNVVGTDSLTVAAQLSSGVEVVYTNTCAFAAIKIDGSVVTWGIANCGGDSSAVAAQLSSGVRAVYATAQAFAALKIDGSVVTWGDEHYGADSSLVAAELSVGVKMVYTTDLCFAAVKSTNYSVGAIVP